MKINETSALSDDLNRGVNILTRRQHKENSKLNDPQLSSWSPKTSKG